MGYASPPPPPTEPGPSCNSASSGLGFVIGVSMGVCGSIGINIGQNLQAAGIQSLDMEDRTKPHKSRTWIIGTTIFVVFSLINFAALALAPASVLTPLESIQFVTNALYNRVVNKAVGLGAHEHGRRVRMRRHRALRRRWSTAKGLSTRSSSSRATGKADCGGLTSQSACR